MSSELPVDAGVAGVAIGVGDAVLAASLATGSTTPCGMLAAPDYELSAPVSSLVVLAGALAMAAALTAAFADALAASAALVAASTGARSENTCSPTTFPIENVTHSCRSLGVISYHCQLLVSSKIMSRLTCSLLVLGSNM